MTQKIIYQKDNTVYVITPADGVDIYSQTKHVPEGCDYEIVIRSQRLPADKTFRDAWTWDGVGASVVENLERSRVIAIDNIKRAAVLASAKAAELEAIFEAPVHSSANIRQAYQSCKDTLTAATTVDELKTCMNSFTTTYEVDS